MLAQAAANGGRMRKARRSQKPDKLKLPLRCHSRSISRLMMKPLTVKNR